MERERRWMDEEEEKAARAYLYPQFSVSNGKTWLCSLQAWVGYSFVNSRNMVLLRCVEEGRGSRSEGEWEGGREEGKDGGGREGGRGREGGGVREGEEEGREGEREEGREGGREGGEGGRDGGRGSEGGRERRRKGGREGGKEGREGGTEGGRGGVRSKDGETLFVIPLPNTRPTTHLTRY